MSGANPHDDWTRALVSASDGAGPTPTVRIDAVLDKLARQRRRRALATVGSGLAVLVAVVALRTGATEAERNDRDESRYSAPAWAPHQSAPMPATQRGERHRDSMPARRPVGADDEPIVEPSVAASASPVTAAAPPQARRSPPNTQPDAETLMARARAARADKDAPTARAALLEVRRRFPDQAVAGHATFLLGRVEADVAHDRAAATRWFERYVADYPDGPLAAEARGRVLTSRIEGGSPTEINRAASNYIEHHPAGAYADLARRQLDPSAAEDQR